MLVQRSPWSAASRTSELIRRFMDADVGAARDKILDRCETYARTHSHPTQSMLKCTAETSDLNFKLSSFQLHRSWNLLKYTAATWLILPVVICLSQRLSHACLSISIIQRNCRRLIKTVMVYLMVHCYLDNRSNSRANTCTKGRLTKPCIY